VRPRAVLGAGLAVGGLGLGLWTAWIAAGNHAAGRELDETNRACDALEVWNASLALEVQAAEERVLAGADPTDEPEGEL
jgi:hypothetical protein